MRISIRRNRLLRNIQLTDRRGQLLIEVGTLDVRSSTARSLHKVPQLRLRIVREPFCSCWSVRGKKIVTDPCGTDALPQQFLKVKLCQRPFNTA